MPFHQIMRSTCPVFTVAAHRLAYGRRYSRATYLTLAPVVAGVALAVWGDVHASPAGFWLTLLGVVLASLKVCPVLLSWGGGARPLSRTHACARMRVRCRWRTRDSFPAG